MEARARHHELLRRVGAGHDPAAQLSIDRDEALQDRDVRLNAASVCGVQCALAMMSAGSHARLQHVSRDVHERRVLPQV